MRKLIVGLLVGGVISSTFASQQKITLISDPKVLMIPIHDTHETWVDLTKQSKLAYGPSPEIPNNTDYTHLRKTIYDKLIIAQKKLPKGLHFCLYEGYRSISLQKMLFETQLANVKKRHPDWSSKHIFRETTKLVSPVINPDKSHNIPPHSTGAAIDIYLIDDHGKAVDMGIHPKDWMSDADGKLSLTSSKHISATAKKNRQIMSEALISVGFVNYPTEYWHWSYGDRYWAYVKHQPQAIYGTSTP
ncbi:M15 family metallopeptidase [Legionella waltersii]|uniref:D-alanyl-D-alanine dipeptidase n=1 Tax=Legionella waltersii TaxID=66969 RepID=A0A0W1ANX5_9GAMM|nr:M15 family metallopeptidase [Legionella waltersii]KTD83051.1 D-alanyl-D-alanine dipeptidase [Legionella waltersii]SNU97528.1 D-alanyl-D-alanine dipeptidase [Legionella waltersii]